MREQRFLTPKRLSQSSTELQSPVSPPIRRSPCQVKPFHSSASLPPSPLLHLIVAVAAAPRLQPPSKESTIAAVQVVGSDSVRPDACRAVVPPSNCRFF
ncbi:hypothetical protein LINPERPRIM_LOCUS2064 [Linum perenne]